MNWGATVGQQWGGPRGGDPGCLCKTAFQEMHLKWEQYRKSGYDRESTKNKLRYLIIMQVAS